MIHLLRLLHRLLAIVCWFVGHKLDIATKKCSCCKALAPMCEWCGERIARASATMGDKVQEVCWECVGVP